MERQRSAARPDSLSMRPPLDGVVQVDNVASVLSTFSQHAAPDHALGQEMQHSPGGTLSSDDGPAPLRRNQACLQCRRRKLKCDATRPHCATCQRSHAHLCRTAPKAQHTLTCTYDDVPEVDFATGQKKRQRKATGAPDGGRKRKTDEDDDDDVIKRAKEEKEALERKIAELEGRLSQTAGASAKTAPPFWEPVPGQAQLSTFPPQIQQPVNPQSPTPFLDMLSSAAAAAQGPLNPPQPSWSSLEEPTRPPAPPMAASGQQKPWWERTDEPSPFSSNSALSGTSGIPHPQQRTESYSSSRTSTSEGVPTQRPQPSFGAALKDPSLLPVDGPWRGVETVAGILNTSSMDIDLQTTAFSLDTDAKQAVPTSQFLLDLLWPNWPPRLPEPSLMSHLIDIFFDSVAGMGRIIHRERFMSRMLLPPSHSGFPHTALLHAICAVAAHFTAWVDTPAPQDRDERTTNVCSYDPEFVKSDFTTQHCTLASEEIYRAIRTGEKTFDVLRAQLILHRALLCNAAWVEAWSVHGTAARQMLPMGLTTRSNNAGYKPATLMEPKDDVEREERRGVLWYTVMTDISSSAMSGWGTSIVMDEVSVPLPTGTEEWQRGLEMAENPQDLESLDLFTAHPIVDSFVLHVKASILSGRVARFQRRWRDRKLRPNDDFEGTQRAEFKQLDSAISCFLMSIPASLKNPLAKTCSSGKSGLDSDLLAAHMLPHAATIVLHEPFADMEDPDNRSAIRVKQATQAVFGIFNLVASSSVDLSLVLHPNLGCDAISAASRTMILNLRIALNNNDAETATGLFQEIQVLLMAYRQLGERLQLGLKQAEMLEMMVGAALKPSYELFACHIPNPQHPRAYEGAVISASPDSDALAMGRFFVTMLNIKRGFWRWSPPGSVDSSASAQLGHASSSAGVTPDSASDRGGHSSNSTMVDTPPELGAKGFDPDQNPAFWKVVC